MPQRNLLTKEYIITAISEDDALSIENSNEHGLLVWDDEDAKEIPFNFLEHMTSTTLSDRIYVSSDIPVKYQVDKGALAEYLWNSCDRNAFITLDELVVIWSEPEDPESFDPPDFIDNGIRHLLEKHDDEYAYEIGAGLLGQLWFERNTVVINMGEIVRTADSIEAENVDLDDPYFYSENQVVTGLLTTAFHELRHLQMDTNIILPEDTYPLTLGTETAVEDYCREAFENSSIDLHILPHLYEIKTKGNNFMGHIQELRMARAQQAFKEEIDSTDKARSFYVDHAGNALGFIIERANGSVLSYNGETGSYDPFDVLPEDGAVDMPPYDIQSGKVVELLSADPTENIQRYTCYYAGYFCGDFHSIITEAEYRHLEETEELYAHDTMCYEPIFDGKIYPTLSASSAAQLAAFGYHFNDDRRKVPSRAEQSISPIVKEIPSLDTQIASAQQRSTGTGGPVSKTHDSQKSGYIPDR